MSGGTPAKEEVVKYETIPATKPRLGGGKTPTRARENDKI